MFRYIALAWDDADARATDRARRVTQLISVKLQQWRGALAAQGLSVFVVGERSGSSEARLLPEGAGVVLGKVFDNHSDPVPNSSVLPFERDARPIVASGGRRLLEEYWGRYVAIVQDRDARRKWVIRDPTAKLPCFMIEVDGLTVFFSSVNDCVTLELGSFSINWKYIAALSCYRRLQNHDTGLQEVSEVQAGECVEIRAGNVTRRMLYWHPVQIAQTDPVRSSSEAIESLRSTVHTCISAWASSYSRIIHMLSGGLDSSIVLKCLTASDERPQITCLNYFDPASPEADERRYARLAAKSAHCELIESEETLSDIKLDSVLDIACTTRSPKPLSYQYYVRHSRFEGELAGKQGATAIFQGIGGDQIFFQGPVTVAAGDYVFENGLTSDLFRLLHGLAHRQRISMWSLLKMAIRDGWLRPSWSPLEEVGRNRALVVPEIIEAARRDETLVHPWLVDHHGLPRGKLWHILTMSVALDFYDPLGLPDYPERVYPLVSQPLMELCLRIPTYILAEDGVDRSVARRAFQELLPPEIATRRTKGVVSRYLQQWLRQNLSFARETLLDGMLVQQKLLDRQKLEQVLAGTRSGVGREEWEILGYHLSTEAWLRSWASSQRLAVA